MALLETLGSLAIGKAQHDKAHSNAPIQFAA